MSSQQRPDTSGTLKTTIHLGRVPSIVQSFHLMKELPEPSEKNGSTNLMAYYNLEHSLNKLSGKKFKEELSSFLPNLPGKIDTKGNEDNSSLKSLIDKPPVTGKEFHPLAGSQLLGFRLQPGPLPEHCKVIASAFFATKTRKRQRESSPCPRIPIDPRMELQPPKSKKERKRDGEKKKKKKKDKKKKDKENEDRG